MTAPMLDLADRLERAGRRRWAAVEEGGGPPWPGGDQLDRAVAVLRAEHADRGLGDPEDGAAPLDRVAEVFGLDPVAATLLWVAAAGDLDATVATAYAHLRGADGPTRPTVALALELAGVPTADRAAFERLGEASELRRHRLLDVLGHEPWLARELAVPEPVLSCLAGGEPADPLVEAATVVLRPLDVTGTEVVERALGSGVPLVWVRSAAGMSGTALAAGALARLGVPVTAVDLRRHAGPTPLTDLVAAAARSAGLRGEALVVTGCEVLSEADAGVVPVLERAAVPVVAVSARPWDPRWSSRHPLLVEAGPLTTDDRRAAWGAELAAHGSEGLLDDPRLHEALLGLRLSGEDVAESVRYAATLAAARGERLGPALVREAARRVGGSGGLAGDRVVQAAGGEPGPTFDDLVLPPHVARSLHQLVGWARHRDRLPVSGGLRGRGRGIAALFTGSPGTGKTLSAHVVAEELAMELYQVDLSSIVDKYIGETEKNLERVFQAAESLDVVLFFDEADALFGSRSGVSDARDRYANQEVAYLLQRMEAFDGVTVLSTNLRGNLDKAFSRRMSFIVHFPDPDEPTRARLWEHHLAHLDGLDPDDPVPVPYLARAAELAGGDVRNIVLAAAYAAADEGSPVGGRHVLAAATREYVKLGRMVPDNGFAGAARRPGG